MGPKENSNVKQSPLPARHGRNDRLPSPGPENRALTDFEVELAQRMRDEQRRWLSEFTINQLEAMGCWNKPDAKLNDLSCPIHPFFAKSKWMSIKRTDVSEAGEKEEDLDVDNPLVWEALKPVLRVSTMLLENQHLWPWLYDLTLGPWTFIKPPDLVSRNEDLAFNPALGTYMFGVLNTRNNPQIFQEKIRETLKKMSNALYSIQFVKWYESADVAQRFAAMAWNQRRQDGYNTICVPQWLVSPLLNETLSASERAHQQFGIATTLVHETMHALGWFHSYIRTPALIKKLRERHCEPFYEDEYMSELGFSWESKVFGGKMIGMKQLPKTVVNEQYGPPFLLCHVCQDWPCWEETLPIYPGGELLRYSERFNNDAVYRLFPTPTRHVEKLSQEYFWSIYVRALGRETLRCPRIWGTQVIRGGRKTMVKGPDWKETKLSTLAQEVPPPPPLYSASNIEQWQHEQQLQARQESINIALREQQRKERREHLRDAITAYERSNLAVVRRLLEDIKQTEEIANNIQRSLLIWAVFEHSQDPDEQKLSAKEGKRAKRSLAWWMSERNPALKDIPIGKILDYPTREINEMYTRIGRILVAAKYLTSEEYQQARWKRIYDIMSSIGGDDEIEEDSMDID